MDSSTQTRQKRLTLTPWPLSDLAFATSSFTSNSLLSTIALLCSIMTGVINPFWAKLADLSARSWCLLASVLLYAIGYACSAGAPNVETFAAGQVIYTIGEPFVLV